MVRSKTKTTADRCLPSLKSRRAEAHSTWQKTPKPERRAFIPDELAETSDLLTARSLPKPLSLTWGTRSPDYLPHIRQAPPRKSNRGNTQAWVVGRENRLLVHCWPRLLPKTGQAGPFEVRMRMILRDLWEHGISPRCRATTEPRRARKSCFNKPKRSPMDSQNIQARLDGRA
jgi:hypothetical protein